MATTKKKAKKKKSNPAQPVMAGRTDFKEVSIEKAQNGFIVRSFTEKGSIKKIAKTKKEAKDMASKML